MRAPAIIGMVTASVLMGSTPVSSLSALRTVDHLRTCSPATARQISLIGSRGAFAIIAVAPQACSQ
jgi:hypothetical protein